MSMATYAYGLPRLGKHREFKKLTEGYWKGEVSQADLIAGLTAVQNENSACYAATVDCAPDGEMSWYDPMLDAGVACGLYAPKDLNEYYELCRGAHALEMTKWFNTNYHYLVPDFTGVAAPSFSPNPAHPLLCFKQGTFPQLIGPYTFLRLAKGLDAERFPAFFNALVETYAAILLAYPQIQLDEPAFVCDVSERDIALIEKGYARLAQSGCSITVMTYYGDVDWVARLLKLPVAAVGLDFVRGKEQLAYVRGHGVPQDKILIAGLIDGRNVWKTDIEVASAIAKDLKRSVPSMAVSNAGPLYHLPMSLTGERKLDPRLLARLSFAEEKLLEIKAVAKGSPTTACTGTARDESFGHNAAVRAQVAALTPADFAKSVSLEARRKLQDERLHLPLFPTTTIGSFPQTAELRAQRAAFRKGMFAPESYRAYIKKRIDEVVAFQEKIGLDVLVHGEFERTDMVEFFAEQLAGIATTQEGWVLSYGTRAYRPPVIFGDVSRPKPMTVDEIAYAQSKTSKPMKGMLTGAVTIIAWSFCREDIPVKDVAYQISLAMRDEIRDYEKAGVKIVQVDEAAFREKAPIKKRDWPAYFDWAVSSFNLATNTDPATQIHSHMCYSEFNEIVEYIDKMDFDVISIEASRSKGDIIAAFEKIDFKRQIGLGVWDIHSPAVPSVEEMRAIVARSLKAIPQQNFWLNPDCGLKTRDWPESEAALKNLVELARLVRV